MIYAGIMAAGFGVRMHRQDLPKPFLSLGSRPIIIHTLEQFLINPRVDSIIVVVAETWKTYADDLIRKYNAMGKEIVVISGGESKTESVSLVARYVTEKFGTGDDDILITHDAIRPFVTQRMIDDNIDTAQEYGAASTVMTTNDTIVVSTDGRRLSEIPKKFMMLAEQTPQTFNLKTLKAVFEKAEGEGVRLKDETELARLFLRFGGEIHLVRGEYSNTKIINPYDLEVSNALLRERSK
ncbi:IspD/TarI family cytidylyltransferase [Lacrimispora sp.]|jgi:2-C-methyl-D-erythritol 4-phosphate cytidylyltransferase|uniref:IspD/TarI family cytidylyltransferase n=1 Tax=Lacrimispora sp. TaxID=2719234 RepID=UPI00289E34E1|nr:2-C-methyl-D-erythritol 4-phosphate cytidylyltransferase [Lacrimispora sp.]